MLLTLVGLCCIPPMLPAYHKEQQYDLHFLICKYCPRMPEELSPACPCFPVKKMVTIKVPF